MPRWLVFAGAALALVAGAAPADADDALWTLLRGGGQVLQTARLAFGRAEPWPALNGGPRDAERVAARVRDVHALLATPPSGGSLVLVTHGFNIRDATGEMPAEGGLVVFTPLGGDRFIMAGRLAPAELATP